MPVALCRSHLAVFDDQIKARGPASHAEPLLHTSLLLRTISPWALLPYPCLVSVEVGYLPIHPPPLALLDRSTAGWTDSLLRRVWPGQHQPPLYHRFSHCLEPYAKSGRRHIPRRADLQPPRIAPTVGRSSGGFVVACSSRTGYCSGSVSSIFNNWLLWRSVLLSWSAASIPRSTSRCPGVSRGCPTASRLSSYISTKVAMTVSVSGFCRLGISISLPGASGCQAASDVP